MYNPVEEFKLLQMEMAELYELKNKDYGSAIEKGMYTLGNVYIACMLFNKTERFINLINKSEEDINFESLEDTLFDIAVYATEGLRVIQKKRSEREAENKENLYKLYEDSTDDNTTEE